MINWMSKFGDKVMQHNQDYGQLVVEKPGPTLGSQFALQAALGAYSMVERRRNGVSLLSPFFMNRNIALAAVATVVVDISRQVALVKYYSKSMHRYGIGSINVAEMPDFDLSKAWGGVYGGGEDDPTQI